MVSYKTQVGGNVADILVDCRRELADFYRPLKRLIAFKFKIKLRQIPISSMPQSRNDPPSQNITFSRPDWANGVVQCRLSL